MLLARMENCMKSEPPMEEALRLVVERLATLPCPAVLGDMFEDAGVGLIWIPKATSQQPGTLRNWSAADLRQVDKLVNVAGSLITAEMRRTGYPIIQRQFDNGASVIFYRRDLAEEARKLCGIMVLQ